MEYGKSNLDKLREAGMTNPEVEPDEETLNRIEGLTDEEVDALISAHRKLGRPSDPNTAFIIPEGGRFP